MVNQRSRTQHKRRRLGLWLSLSIIFNLIIWIGLERVANQTKPNHSNKSRPVELVFMDPSTPEPPDQDDTEEHVGQIVDLPDPTLQERPEDAEYLAETDRLVEMETRTEDYKINPEIIAPEYSEDSRLELEDLEDVGADESSTGAQVGNDRFDPQEDGSLAALPSPYQLSLSLIHI